MTAPTRVLVTGGAGFIGSHLTERLLDAGLAVTVLDDLSSGRVENLPTVERLRFVHGDASRTADVDRALEDCHAVAHLAASPSVQRSVEDPAGTHAANYLSTLCVLEACRRRGVRRLVYASSAAVYGDAPTHPIHEGTPTDPRSPYAIDKLMGEHAVRYYHREHGVDGVILRFFNVYGPRQAPDSAYSGVISIFAQHVRRGHPVVIHGDGTQTRDFVYVGDVVACIHGALRLEGHQEAPLVVNVGTGSAVSLLQLVEVLERIEHRPVPRTFGPWREGDVRHSQADVTRLRRFLGEAAHTSLDEGLARLLSASQRAGEGETAR